MTGTATGPAPRRTATTIGEPRAIRKGSDRHAQTLDEMPWLPGVVPVMKLLQATMVALNADRLLLFAWVWPDWVFDAPCSMGSLPFLDEQA